MAKLQKFHLNGEKRPDYDVKHFLPKSDFDPACDRLKGMLLRVYRGGSFI